MNMVDRMMDTHKRSADCPLFIFQFRCIHDCHMCGDGIEHMNAWKNICGGICPVDEAYQPDKNVVSGKFCRPQQVSVGINGGNDQK